MVRRAVGSVLLLALGGGAFLSLLRGAGLLEAALPGGLPLGNAIASLGLCAFAGASCVLTRPGSRSHRVARVTLLGAFAWLPVAAALAGNLALNFDGWPGTAFLAWSALVLAAVLGMLGWTLMAALVAARRHLGRA